MSIVIMNYARRNSTSVTKTSHFFTVNSLQRVVDIRYISYIIDFYSYNVFGTYYANTQLIDFNLCITQQEIQLRFDT